MSYYIKKGLASLTPNWFQEQQQRVISNTQDTTQDDMKNIDPKTQPQPPQYGLPQTHIPYSATQPNKQLNVKRQPTSAEFNPANEQDIILENKRRKANSGKKVPIVSERLPTTERLKNLPPSQSVQPSQNNTGENQAMIQGLKKIGKKRRNQFWPKILGDDSSGNYANPNKVKQYFENMSNAKANGQFTEKELNASVRYLNHLVRELNDYDGFAQQKGDPIPEISPSLLTIIKDVVGPDELNNVMSILPPQQWKSSQNTADMLNSLSQIEKDNLTQAPSTYETEPPESFQQNSQNMNYPNNTQPMSTQQTQIPQSQQIQSQITTPNLTQAQTTQQTQPPSTYQIESQQPSDVEQPSTDASTIASNMSFPNRPLSNTQDFSHNLSLESTQKPTLPYSNVSQNLSQNLSNLDEDKKEFETQQDYISQYSNNNNYSAFPDDKDYDISQFDTEDTIPDYRDEEKYVPMKSASFNSSQGTIPVDTGSIDENQIQSSQTQPLSTQQTLANTLPYTQSQSTEQPYNYNMNFTQQDSGISANLTQKDSGISANLTSADSGITPISNQSTITQTPSQNTNLSGQTTQTETQPSNVSSLSGQTTQTETQPSSYSTGSTTETETQPSSQGSNSTLTQSQNTNPSLAQTLSYIYNPNAASQQEVIRPAYNNDNRPVSQIYEYPNSSGTSGTSGTSSSGQSLGTTVANSQSASNLTSSQMQPNYPPTPAIAFDDTSYFYKNYILPDFGPNNLPQAWEREMVKQINQLTDLNMYRYQNREPGIRIPQQVFDQMVWKVGPGKVKQIFMLAGKGNDMFVQQKIDEAIRKYNSTSQENPELKQSETSTAPNQPKSGLTGMPLLERGTTMQPIEQPTKIEDVEMQPSEEEKKEEQFDIVNGNLKDVAKQIQSYVKNQSLTVKNQFPGVTVESEGQIEHWLKKFRERLKENPTDQANINKLNVIPEISRLQHEAMQQELNRIENEQNPSELDKRLKIALTHPDITTAIKFPYLRNQTPEDVFNPDLVKKNYINYLSSRLSDSYNNIKEVEEANKKFDDELKEYQKLSGDTETEFKHWDNLHKAYVYTKRNLESDELKEVEANNKKLWAQFQNTDLERGNMTKDNFDEIKKKMQTAARTPFKNFLTQWEDTKRDFLKKQIENEVNKAEQIAKRDQTHDTFEKMFIKFKPEPNDNANALMEKYDAWKDFEKNPEYGVKKQTVEELNNEYENMHKEYTRLTGKTAPRTTVNGLKNTQLRNGILQRYIDNFKLSEKNAEETENALRAKYQEVKHKFDNLTHTLYNESQWKLIKNFQQDPETAISSLRVSDATKQDPDARREKLSKYVNELKKITDIIDVTERQHSQQEIQKLQNQYDQTHQDILRFKPGYKLLSDKVGNNLNDAKKNLINLQNEYKQNEETHVQLFKDVVNFKQVLDAAQAYEDGLTEKQIHELSNEDLTKMKIKLETEASKLKTNMGAYSKNQMFNYVQNLQLQMKEMDPHSVPIIADHKYFQTLSEEKAQELLESDLAKFKDLQNKRNDLIEQIQNDADKTRAYKRFLEKQKRFTNYQPILPEDVQDVKTIAELQNYAHIVRTAEMEGKRYVQDVENEWDTKNNADIKNSQIQMQHAHEINMEKGRQFYGKLQHDENVAVRKEAAIRHQFDTVMSTLNKTQLQSNQITHEKDIEKSRRLTNLFVENRKHNLKATEQQDKKAMHLIDSNLRKEEITMKHEDNLYNNYLKTSLQESNFAFQQNLQTNKLTQEAAESKLDRDLQTSLANSKNNTDVIKSLIDYDLKGNQIIKKRGIEDRRLEMTKQLGDRYLETVKNYQKRGILDLEHNHSKEILNIQQRFEKSQAENEQELKHLEFEEKIELDKYLNKQVLRSKRQLQSGEHRFKMGMHTKEQQEKTEQTQKKIQSAESFIDAVIPDLEELQIPYKYPAQIVSAEDADLQIKYFSDLKEKIRDIPAERKKIEALAERAKRLPQDIQDELGLFIPHRDDINKMDYQRLQEVKKDLTDAFQNNKIDQLELGRQREHALKLNKYIDDINSMSGAKIYPNIEMKNAPKNIQELEIQENRLKERYDQIRQDLKLANTQKASLYTEIEEIRKELGPNAKHLIPKLTEYKNFESQKNNLYSGNLELVQKQVGELGKILREAHAAQRFDTNGKYAENTLDTYLSGLRTIAGDSTTFYKLLQNAAYGRNVYKDVKVDPITAQQLVKNSRDMFEMVAKNSFMKNVGRKNEHEIGLIVDSAKQMYEMSGLSKELGAKWEDIEHALDYESPLRKSATVQMLAKSQPLSEMYLVNLALNVDANKAALNTENPVKLYTAMRSMGVNIDMNKINGKSPLDINRQLLEQIPPHLLGEANTKKIASEEELNMASWMRQTKNVDTYSENWVGENMLTGNSPTQAMNNILGSPGYHPGAPISRLDFGTGNFYPVKSLKDVKGHEAYFLNKPSDLRNIPRLKKDAILHQANALMGPFGLAYGNDKRRRSMVPLGMKPSYVHLAKFLNALPQTKTFLNNKEKLLAKLHGKKRRLVPSQAAVKKHYKRRRKARVLRKKLKNKLKKKVKIDENGGGKLVDDSDDEGGVFDYDSEVDFMGT